MECRVNQYTKNQSPKGQPTSIYGNNQVVRACPKTVGAKIEPRLRGGELPIKRIIV